VWLDVYEHEFRKKISNMDNHRADQPSYVLWLIRSHNGMTKLELIEHFNLELKCPTERTSLDYTLNKLQDAGLIQNEQMEGVEKIRATPLMSKIHTVLNIDFKELAIHSPQSMMMVSPTFGLPLIKFKFDAFVLMPFKTELLPIYQDHIKKIAHQLGISIGRADDFFTTQSIMEEIWSAIANSKLIIADCTGRNPNVFYEIGIAHSLGKPVVLITQDVEDIPADLRHRRFIKYEYTPPGVQHLEKLLKDTLKELNNPT